MVVTSRDYAQNPPSRAHRRRKLVRLLAAVSPVTKLRCGQHWLARNVFAYIRHATGLSMGRSGKELRGKK